MGLSILIRYNALVFVLSNVLEKGLPFLLLPFFAHALSPEDFGNLALFMSLVPLLNLFITLSSDAAVGVHFFKSSQEEHSGLISASLLVSALGFAMTFFVSVVVWPWLNRMVEVGPLWYLVALGNSFAFAILAVHQSLARAQKRALRFAFFQVGRVCLELSLAVPLVLALQGGWTARVGSYVFSMMFAALLALFFIFKQYPFKVPNFGALKKVLHFGIPLMPHGIAGWVMSYSDRFFISNYVGLAETGIYTMAFTLGQAFSVIIQGLNQAWSPFVFELLTKSRRRSRLRIVQMTMLGLMGAPIAGLLFYFAARAGLTLFFPATYSSGGPYIFWISMSYAFDAMYTLICTFIFFNARTLAISAVTSSVAALKIILSFWIIPRYGAMGAAQLTCLSFALMFVFTWFLSDRIYPLPWKQGFLYLLRKRHLA